MVLDTSVLAHVLFQEAGWDETTAFLALQSTLLVPAGSIIELQAVMSRRFQRDAYEILDATLEQLGIRVADLTAAQANIARQAWLRYGKGQGHPAQLNFGGVLSYALAQDSGRLLACVGNDFTHTDLRLVRLPLQIS